MDLLNFFRNVIRIDPPASTENINHRKQILEAMEQIKSKFPSGREADGRLIVYLTGHCKDVGDGAIFITGPEHISDTEKAHQGIHTKCMKKCLSEINVSELIVITDCCHAAKLDILPEIPRSQNGRFRVAVQLAACFPGQKAELDANGSHFTKVLTAALSATRTCPAQRLLTECPPCSAYDAQCRLSEVIRLSSLQNFCNGHPLNDSSQRAVLHAHYDKDVSLAFTPNLPTPPAVTIRDVWNTEICRISRCDVPDSHESALRYFYKVAIGTYIKHFTLYSVCICI